MWWLTNIDVHFILFLKYREDKQFDGIYNSNGKLSNNNNNNNDSNPNRIINGPFIIERNSTRDTILPDSYNNGSSNYYDEIPHESLHVTKTNSKKKSKFSRIFS